MKTLNKILIGLLAVTLTLTACDPNKELYEQLDAMQKPIYKAIAYTLTEADYNSINEPKDDPIEAARVKIIKAHMAFVDTIPAMDYIPAMLARKYLALKLGRSAMVTYNFMVVDTVRTWEKAVFGYTLTNADYEAIGGSVGTYKNFWSTNPAKNHLPGYLPNLYPSPSIGQRHTIIYNFWVASNLILPYADIYEFNGEIWMYIETITDMVEADYILTSDDYLSMGLSTPRFPNLGTADRNLPIWLKIKYPFAYAGDTLILLYAYGGTTSTSIASQYSFTGEDWVKSGYAIETRSEQYVYALSGWVFDPTIRFIMERSDYDFIARADPIPHPRFVDQGYYYSASAYYRNFDVRLLSFHLRVYTWGENIYDPEVDDPELVEIFNNEGPEAATEELFRRIVQEGLIVLLENKFPDAQPLVGGVDSHFVVGFETYNDNLSRSYLEAEYKCIAPASGDSPPAFEFVDGPRQRQ